MNKTFISFLVLFTTLNTFSQKYDFQIIKDIETTPVTAQQKTGTCWSFSSTSFLEAEIIRKTGASVDLSEMYTVRNIYMDKAENYVMRQGKAQFGEGGLNHDVINSVEKYGVTKQKEYSGKADPNAPYDHSLMLAELEDILKKVVEITPKKYPNWKADYNSILDKHMGKIEDIKPMNKERLLQEYKINLNDYITLTSFTHVPYHTKFILNIPDNFSNGYFHNITLDEFVQNIDNALDKGYTVALDCDVSESTFSSKTGIAVVPQNEADTAAIVTEIKPEKVITAEFRQAEFENYNTTDDHLMHIVGKARDQKGNIYYKVKNSWGKESGKDGYMFMSVPYLRLKAISVMLHKEALITKTKKTFGF
jgi:bleomycin hydrolase